MSPASYKVLFAAQWAFPGVMLLFALIMPESPWYLVRKNKITQAEKSLARLHSKGYDITKGLAEIQAAVEAEEAQSVSQTAVTYLDCFRSTDFRRTRIACGMFLVQQFTGIAFYSQALYFLGISGLPTALTFQLALGGFGVAMAGNVVSWFIMNYVGRRPLLLTGVMLNAILLLSVGIAGTSSKSAALYYIAYVMNFAQLFYAPTVGAVSWSISGEVSSIQKRAKTQSLCTITNALASWVLNFICPYLINTDQANLGGKAAFVWSALSFIGLVWVWYEVPEIKDRSFSALDIMFSQRVPTRKFKAYEVERTDAAGKQTL